MQGRGRREVRVLRALSASHSLAVAPKINNFLRDTREFEVLGGGAEPPAVNPSLILSPDKPFITSQHCGALLSPLSACRLPPRKYSQVPEHVPEREAVGGGKTTQMPHYATAKHYFRKSGFQAIYSKCTSKREDALI